MPKARVELRIDSALKDELETWAAERKRSLNNLIEILLTMCVDDPPEPLIAEVERRTA